jgi:hypothetical protein
VYHLPPRYNLGDKYHTEIMVPPAILMSQHAECVLAAIMTRCSDFLWPAPRANRAVVLILASDSHKALVRLAMHWANQANSELPDGHGQLSQARFFLHARCMMHLGLASVTNLLKKLDIINGVFCATHLLHRGKTMDQVRLRVRALIRERLAFEYQPPRPDDVSANLASLKLLDKVDEELLEAWSP